LNTYSKFKKVQGLENVGGHTGEAEATWNGSGVGAGSGSGYQISYSFSMGEVVGAQAACPDPTLPTVGVFVGSFAFAGDDSTDDPFRTIYKFDENYVLDTEDCTNTGCNQCNNDFVEGLNDDGPIELLSEFIPEEDPFECDTEFDICTCVPTTGTVCMEILETNFMNAEDAPLTFWNFGVTWKDNYGQLPTLQ
jgi:hypothetical protein